MRAARPDRSGARTRDSRRTGGRLEADERRGRTATRRSEELARIESALAEARAGRGMFVVIEGPAGIGKTALLAAARTAAADSGMRVLRSRGTELEREFAFGVVRQLFESPLAEASELERADLLQGAAGVAAGLLGLRGAPATDGPPSSVVDPSFAIVHGLYWLAPIWQPSVRSASSSTTHTGQTPPRCVTSPSCSRASKSWTPRSSLRPARGRRARMLSCLRR